MARKTLVFSGIFLYLNNNSINIDSFKDVLLEGSYRNTDGSKVEIYNLVYEDNYLKINFGDGAIRPRNPKVFNFSIQEEEPNPRQKEQVEPKETFALLDFNTSHLWISNSKKRNILARMLQHKFPKDRLVMKEVYDEEEFISTLKKLDSLKVSAVPNLFANTGILSESLTEEINGYDASVATLSFTYYNTLTTEYLLNKIRSLFAEKNTLRSIVIAGRDENNLGMLFNTEGFSRKIDVDCTVDENEMFLPEDVFLKLINKIKSESF